MSKKKSKKYRTELVNGEEVVKFTKTDIRKYLEECIIYWRNKRSQEADISEGLMISNRIDVFQSVYTSLFGYTYPL